MSLPGFAGTGSLRGLPQGRAPSLRWTGGGWNFYGPTHPSAIPFRPEFRLTMAAACIDLSGPGFGSDPAALLVVPMAPFLFMHVFLHKVSLFPWAENTIILLEPGCQWERIVISHKNMY